MFTALIPHTRTHARTHARTPARARARAHILLHKYGLSGHTIGQDSETPRLNKASPFAATAQT